MARILIIEDNPPMGSALRDALTEDGHDVTWAQDYRAAVLHLRQDPFPFDLVLLDYALSRNPKAPTGEAWARRLVLRDPPFAGAVVCMSSDPPCNAQMSEVLTRAGVACAETNKFYALEAARDLIAAMAGKD